MKLNNISISIVVLLFATGIVVFLTNVYDAYKPGFYENVLVEAHGMLFDILVIGVIILSLNKLTEKGMENQRYLDEIDDFRGWKSEEAAFRNAGNIKRLNRNGFKGKINLATCNLTSVNLKRANLAGADLGAAVLTMANLYKADLAGANLTVANLVWANLKGANFTEVNMQWADLSGAELSEAINLKIYQLSGVKTLYNAKLDPELMVQVKEKYPHLLEEPEEGKK